MNKKAEGFMRVLIILSVIIVIAILGGLWIFSNDNYQKDNVQSNQNSNYEQITKPINKEVKDDGTKTRCSLEAFGEFKCNEQKTNYPDSWCTWQSLVDHYTSRFCTNNGGIEILPYLVNGQCSAFDCKCSSGDLLYGVMEEKTFCNGITIRNIGFCTESEFMQDSPNFASSVESFKQKCIEKNMILYFIVDGNTLKCSNPQCLTLEQYNLAKNDMEYLY